jgi:hypothetical protein
LQTNELQQHDFQQNTQITNQPYFCIYNCFKCKAKPTFKIDDINSPNFISQSKINDELFLHGHKKSLLMPRSKKFRNVREAKAELLAHYKFAHNFF